MSQVNAASDRSEWALRGFAALLAVLFLFGVAACGNDLPEAEATVAIETPVSAKTPVPAADTSTEVPETETGSDPASTVEVSAVNRVVSYEEAEGAYHSGEYGAAVDLFSAYTGQKPENPWGHYMMGLSAWKAGHLDVAETALAESVRLSPNHVKGHVNLARVLLEAGRLEEALEHATLAEDIDPASVQAKRTLARAQAETGDVEGALEMYEQALWIDPEDTWSLNNLGYLLLQVGRYDEAMGPLALATMLDSDNPLFFNNLGSALEGSGHTVAAARAFESAATLDPDYGKATASVARLQPLVGEAGELEVDLVVVGEEFRQRLMGAVEEANAPPHRPGTDGSDA